MHFSLSIIKLYCRLVAEKTLSSENSFRVGG